MVSGDAPAGAVVIDDRLDEHAVPVQDGSYAADLGGAPALEPVVRFEDAGGGLVAVALPEGERTTVADATEPCPACAAVAWVVAAGEVCCERCGFRLGRLWSANSGLASSASMVMAPVGEAQVVERLPLRVPAFAVPGLSARAHRGYDEQDRVTVTHRVPGKLKITTSTAVDADLRTVLEDQLDDNPDFEGRTQSQPR